MSGDPQRKDDPTPDAAEVEAVYAFLRRTHGDLVRSLERTLPVDAAVKATLGPEPEPSARTRPAPADRLRLPLPVPRHLQVVPALRVYFGQVRDITPVSTLEKIDADLKALIGLAKSSGRSRSGVDRPSREHDRVQALDALRELRAGLEERGLSKERARSLIARAERHLEPLARTRTAARTRSLSVSLLPVAFLAAILGFTAPSWVLLTLCGVLQACVLGEAAFRASTRSSPTRVKDTFARLRAGVDLLFDDSDDHSGTAVRR